MRDLTRACPTLGLQRGQLAIDEPSFVPNTERYALPKIFEKFAALLGCCGWLPSEGDRLVLQFRDGNLVTFALPHSNQLYRHRFEAALTEAIRRRKSG